jgi:hypothetical protein
MSKPTKVVVIRELKIGPTQFQAEVERLKAAGKFPSLDELLAAVASARAEFVPKILAARRKRGAKCS